MRNTFFVVAALAVFTVTAQGQVSDRVLELSKKYPQRADDSPGHNSASEGAAAQVSIWPDAFSRRNYKLGMTLKAFKQARYPDEKKWPGAFPVCSNAIPAQLANSPEVVDLQYHLWKEIGVIMCEFFYHSNDLTRLTGRDLWPAGLMLGNVSPMTNQFYFAPTEKGGEPLLFLVASEFPSDRFDETVLAFEELLGKPKTSSNQSVQNKIGNTFQNTIIQYENQVSLIILERFGQNLNRSSVKYIGMPLYDAVVKSDEARKGRAVDRL